MNHSLELKDAVLKVYTYIVRDKEYGPELLVFSSPKLPGLCVL